MKIEERIKAYYLNKTLQLTGSEKLHLGSSSPRRIQMISEIKKPDRFSSPFVEEERILEDLKVSIDEEDTVLKNSIATALLAKSKAESISIKNNEILITADTTVLLKDKILGKPKSNEDAEKMLLSLSNKIHYVTTGVCLYKNEGNYNNFFLTTAVKFRKLEGPLVSVVKSYVSEGKALDKAGAYGIQEEAGLFVEWIYGDYNNIVGLPLGEIFTSLGGLFSENSN